MWMKHTERVDKANLTITAGHSLVAMLPELSCSENPRETMVLRDCNCALVLCAKTKVTSRLERDSGLRMLHNTDGQA